MNFGRIALAASLGLALAFPVSLRAEEPVQPKPKPQPREIKVKPAEGKVEVKELLKDEHDHDDAKPAAKPEPKKLEAKVAPEAKVVLDKLSEAYRKIGGLELSGTMTGDFLAGGQIVDQKGTFVASFAAPMTFRHEMKGDIVVGSTGKTMYAYRAKRNDYKQADAPADRPPGNKIPNPMRDVLREQDLALLLTIVEDAGKFLAETSKEISKAADETIDGKTYIALDVKGGEKMNLRLLIDPKTNLIRRVVQDRRRDLEDKGQSDVTRATVTIDYARTKADAKPEPREFAWVPPEGAKDAAAVAAEAGEAMALVGKDAPDFTLTSLDGKKVAMVEQQGSVVVLDFWATWCGPCQESLPGLNKLYKDLNAKGLKVFAVDLEEPKEKVQPVAAKLIPDLTVLLDENSDAAKLYGVGGIPQTVVVGRDGKVKNVFIGSGNDANIRAAVEKALSE
jgi:peroxiredoxin/outer membrane lipoprotein-sorting protein